MKRWGKRQKTRLGRKWWGKTQQGDEVNKKLSRRGKPRRWGKPKKERWGKQNKKRWGKNNKRDEVKQKRASESILQKKSGKEKL